MRIRYDYWYGGKKGALTMSYDDGPADDLRLVSIFDRYGIRGTFHLNSGVLGRDGRLSKEDLAEKFGNHEISVHTVTHPFPRRISREELTYEIVEDRRALESICGYPVRGMSYPYGEYDAAVMAQVGALGMQYSRTTHATNSFGVPENFLAWHPTCHHNADLEELLKKFRAQMEANRRPLFYVWGHSFEFPRDNNWEKMEEFCRAAGGDPDVWYATNIEIYDYVCALKALIFTADRTRVMNPTATDVWISVDDNPVHVPAGKTIALT